MCIVFCPEKVRIADFCSLNRSFTKLELVQDQIWIAYRRWQWKTELYKSKRLRWFNVFFTRRNLIQCSLRHIFQVCWIILNDYRCRKPCSDRKKLQGYVFFYWKNQKFCLESAPLDVLWSERDESRIDICLVCCCYLKIRLALLLLFFP